MSNLHPTLQDSDFTNVCAEHTRRIQLLSGKFWQGDIDMWHYRKTTRELTQQFVEAVDFVMGKGI
jgi:hypothetical protein